MEDNEENPKLDINYEIIKVEKTIYMIIGRILTALSLGLSLGSFIYVFNPSEDTFIQSNHFLMGYLVICLMLIATVCFYFAYYLGPPCAYCLKRTSYSHKSKQFYCKRCKRYF